MSAFLHKYDRCLASIFASICSFMVWIWVGELRWIDPPWYYTMSPTDHQVVYGTMYWLDVSSKLLGVIAIIWAGVGVWKIRTRFAKAVLIIALLALLISLVP